MARAIPLGTLVTRCKRRADRESDESISTAEWKALISEKYGELHGAVAEAGLAYFESTADITAAGESSHSLNAAVLSVVAVDRIVNSTTGEKDPLQLIMGQERAFLAGATGQARFYAFTGSSIELWPRPSTGTYRVTYVPQSTDYSSSSDDTSVDVVTADGEAFLIWGVAAMACDKGEADLRFKASQANDAKERLQIWATNRALHEPKRRVIASSSLYGDPIGIDPQDWRYR